jgi:cytochrome P450
VGAATAPIRPAAPPRRSTFSLRRDLLGGLVAAHREAGDVVRLAPARMPVYAVFHPDDAQRVLQGNADGHRKDNTFYRELRWSFGAGLLTSQDDAWLRQRRFVQPLFTRKRIDGYAETMLEETDRRLDGWRTGAVVDLDAEMTR